MAPEVTDPLEDEWFRLEIQAGQVFTLAAPIDAKELFAGRTAQLRMLIDAICQRGQHAIIYGERGVGKTSLANVHSQFLEDIGSKGEGKKIVAPRINCGSDDNFSKLWKKIFAEIRLSRHIKKIGFIPGVVGDTEIVDLPNGINEVIVPDDVRVMLTQLSQDIVLVVIIDEFDCIEDERVKAQMSESIKTLSDHAVHATLVIVGVADSVTDLIAHHESIERSLVQIHLPRMSKEEMGGILNKGLTKLGMTIQETANKRIADLSRGLPHYVHLLGLFSAREAIRQRRKSITVSDVGAAIEKSIANAQQSIRHMYYEATLGRKKDSIYARLLLACALAKADEFGYFTAADIREPMSRLMKRKYDIPYFARQLHELCTKSRGEALQKSDAVYRPRFRFKNPLLQPYVIMQGFKDGQLVNPVPAAK